MDIVTRIKTIVDNLGISPQLKFIYGGEREWANMIADSNTIFPVFFLLGLPKQSGDIGKSGYIEKHFDSPFVIFIANKSDLTKTPMQQLDVVYPCELLADQFVRAAGKYEANHNRLFADVRNYKGEWVHNMFDQNISGYLFSVELMPFEEGTTDYPNA